MKLFKPPQIEVLKFTQVEIVNATITKEEELNYISSFNSSNNFLAFEETLSGTFKR